MSFTTLLVPALLALGALVHPSEAKCSHDVAERGLEMHQRLQEMRASGQTKIYKRDGPKSVADEESLTTPEEECVPYDYPPISSDYASWPPIWKIASIVDGDTEATDAYNAIINMPNFPNTPPKGQPDGNFTGVSYNASDPDCWWSWSKCDTPKVAGLPQDITVCNEPNTLGLSYDDGPNCSANAWLETLKEQQYTATLFYIGSNVADWPYQAKEGVDNGHEVGVHTWSHRYCTALTNEQFFAELWYTRKMIKTVLGITPTTWRPPYGDVDDRIRFIANAMNMTTTMWEHDTFDWKIVNSNNPNGLPTASVVANYDAVFQDAQSGSFNTQGTIVLMHELNNATMSVNLQELPMIQQNFKHIVPLATCLNISHPYVEQSYTFPTFSEYLATNQTRWTNSSSSSSSGGSMTTSAAGSSRTASTISGGVAAANKASNSTGAASSVLSISSAGVALAAVLAWATVAA